MAHSFFHALIVAFCALVVISCGIGTAMTIFGMLYRRTNGYIFVGVGLAVTAAALSGLLDKIPALRDGASVLMGTLIAFILAGLGTLLSASYRTTPQQHDPS